MKIFYSWQSDLPNKTNRSLIEDAIQRGVDRAQASAAFDIEPVIDRDTKGVPGSPGIASTILKKIDESAVFVGDVSFVTNINEGRPSPNPNVLIELGYALRTLGEEQIILVFNSAFGDVSELPFDLKGRRVLVYELAVSESPGEQREHLSRTFEAAFTGFMERHRAREAQENKSTRTSREATLDEVISRAPIEDIEDGDSRGWLHIFSQPVLPTEDLAGRIESGGSEVWRELIMTAVKSGPFLERYVPDFQLTRVEPTVSGWSLYMSGRPEKSRERRSEEVLDLSVSDDGFLELHCGRAGDGLDQDRFVIIEMLVAGLTLKFCAFAGALYERGEYSGPVELGLAITGIKGAEPYRTLQTASVWIDSPGFKSDRYTRTSRASASSLVASPRDIAAGLLKPFFRGLTHGYYDPLEESKV